MASPDDLSLGDIENEYQRALAQARRRTGALNTDVARRVETALRLWAEQLERRVATLPDQRAAWALQSAQLTRQTADELATTVIRATDEARTVAYEETLDIWRRALGRIVGDAREADRLLGALHVPSLSLVGQYAGLGAATTWKTLVRDDAARAAAEADALIVQALTAGVGPEELGRRLRRYVQGSQTFAALFRDVETPDGTTVRLDLRRLPAALRGAGRKVDYQARRIAFTELHNARAEAEVQYFRVDPLVAAVRWQLSPDRGTQVLPDECDLLAKADWYGLGPGIYPVTHVPAPPHPFDRCERMPVARTWAGREEPKMGGDFDPQAWRAVSYLGRTTRRSSWQSTVHDALQALARGRAVAA